MKYDLVFEKKSVINNNYSTIVLWYNKYKVSSWYTFWLNTWYSLIAVEFLFQNKLFVFLFLQ